MIRIDPARLGATYATLMAAHDVGDHVVQTDHQAATKAISWAGMAGHVGSYTALQVAALAGLRQLAGVRPSWRRTATAVLWSAGTHAFLDRRWPVLRILELTGSSRFAHPRVFVLPTGDDVGMAGPLPIHGPYQADGHPWLNAASSTPPTDTRQSPTSSPTCATVPGSPSPCTSATAPPTTRSPNSPASSTTPV